MTPWTVSRQASLSFTVPWSLLKLMSIGASPITQLVKICPQCRRPWFDSWVRKICWRRDRLPIPVFLGFPCGSAGKESACRVGDLGSIPGLGRSSEEGKDYPLQCSQLENSTDCHKESDTTEQLSLHMSIESVMPSNHLILCCPFSSCPQSFPASGSFPMSQLISSGGQSIGASASGLPMNIWVDFI